jgi:hypothetical protein
MNDSISLKTMDAIKSSGLLKLIEVFTLSTGTSLPQKSPFNKGLFRYSLQ